MRAFFNISRPADSLRLPVQRKARAISLSRSRWAITCSAWASPPELATTSVPIAGSLAMNCIISGKESLLANPVTSEGLDAHPNPFNTPLIPSRAVSLSSGRSKPTWPHMSAVRELIPPEWDTTAKPWAGGGGELARRLETSKSSS